MSASGKSRTASFADGISQGSIFLTSLDELKEYPSLLPYAHYVAQAWEELQLSGVLCVDGRPTVYLVEADQQELGVARKRELQQFAWNQGLAPLLIFLSQTTIEVHSTVKRPVAAASGELFEDELPSLIPSLTNVATALECAQFVRSIETGHFFQEHAAFFPTNETVDYCLVENLAYSAKKLADTGDDWNIQTAHALLGRVLFVSFLQERKFIKQEYYPHGSSSLLDLLTSGNVAERKRRLYDEFFERLRIEFNGTMFDSELQSEKTRIRASHLEIVANFLNGTDMRTGQMTLGFWAYDFRVIPVETISAIYEEFLNLDPNKRRADGAYYTPRHLAETALHIALDGRYTETENWKILDPACGSGIFLVGLFNLLSELWMRQNHRRWKKTKAQALLDILQNQIRGIDKNPDACRIAAFSLYLALFEKLRPTDVDEFKANVRLDKFLPPLLEALPQKCAVVTNCDFLNEAYDESGFDLIIGNPPWESRGDKQIGLHFAERTREYLRPDGVCCLILPTTILVNLHGTLDNNWFQSVKVERIVQLADFRRLLFKATHACFVLRYSNTRPSIDFVVQYETPKVSRFDRRRGIIVVEPDDHKSITLREIIEAGLQDRLQSIWSQNFWGTARDVRFLRRLDSLPRLNEVVGDQEAGRRFVGGVGFQPYYPGVSPKNPKPIAPWRSDDLYVENDASFPKLVLTRTDCVSLKEGLLRCSVERDGVEISASLEELRRKPEEIVFTPPMVVFSEGFTKFAFSSRLVRFQNSLRSISGKRSDENILRFLTVVLASSLMKYIAFHSGSSNGIGRDKLHLHESLSLPFPLPGSELLSSDAEGIVRASAKLHRQLEKSLVGKSAKQRSELSVQAMKELDLLVRSYYMVSQSEGILIDETISIFRPSIHRSSLDADIPSLRFPDSIDRERYAETLGNTLRQYARRSKRKFAAECLASEELGLVMFIVYFDGRSADFREAGTTPELWKALEKLQKASEKTHGHISYLRGFSYFDRDRLYILKPATLRNWSQTAALNDADTIFEYLNAGHQ